MEISDRWRMSPALRRTSAVIAITALAIGGAKVTSDHTMPGSGFSTVATVAADPTGGPTGGPGGPDGMNGGAFQPPGLPPQMPDYQGGINQPPLDQNSGISIYNTGSPGAQQVPSQQGAQQPQQAQQPQHGSQIPDYQTATPYTQGPGKANPDYQAPQQGNQAQQPQQGQQPQQQQQPDQQQQPQNKQDDSTRQLNDQQQQQREQQCQLQASKMGIDAISTVSDISGGGAGSLLSGPGQQPDPGPQCNGYCPEQLAPSGYRTEPDGTRTWSPDKVRTYECLGPVANLDTGQCSWGDAGRCVAALGSLGIGVANAPGAIAKVLESASKLPKAKKSVEKLLAIVEQVSDAYRGTGPGRHSLPDAPGRTSHAVKATGVLGLISAIWAANEFQDTLKQLVEDVGGTAGDVLDAFERCVA